MQEICRQNENNTCKVLLKKQKHLLSCFSEKNETNI